MIRLTRCSQASKAGTYFRLHLQSGDSPTRPAAPGITLKSSWVGSALPEVNLAPFDPPTDRHLVRLGRGLHPSQNKRLAPARNRKRAYYDLTIASPKTISLGALLEPNHPVAKSVMRAHMDAVEAVARAAGKMIEPQNAKGAPTDKWLGVLFHHTHTRENDPHLHSHLILPNLMLDQKGQWRAMQVVIAGPMRLKLELLYGHTLATHLRRLGFGEEIAMRPNGTPELRTLQPMVRTFAKAQAAVSSAATAAESEPATKKRAKGVWQQGSRPRAFPHGFYDNDRLDHRARLADQQRKPKPRDADDPVKLTHEAERWTREIANGDYRKLMALLDKLDRTNPRRQALIVREGPPPPAREIVQASYMNIPEGSKTTGPIVFRGAVVLSAGRHDWEELVKETRAKMARRKKALARIKAQIEADSLAIAQAQAEAANQAHQAHAARLAAPQPVPPAAAAHAPASTPAPTPAAQKSVPAAPSRPARGRGR